MNRNQKDRENQQNWKLALWKDQQNKPLARLIKTTRQKAQITKIMTERRDLSKESFAKEGLQIDLI